MLVTLGSHAREWAVAFAAWEPPLLGIRDLLSLALPDHHPITRLSLKAMQRKMLVPLGSHAHALGLRYPAALRRSLH